MAIRSKVNIKTYSTHKELAVSAKKRALKETLKSYKMNPIDSDSTKFIAIGVEACSKVFQGLLEALKRGDKMFQKFVETLGLFTNYKVKYRQE